MMKALVYTLFACAILMAAPSVFSQGKSKAATPSGSIRIGVADMETIAKQLPEAIEADKKLTDLRQKFVDTLKMMEKQYVDELEKYKKGEALMTADAKKSSQETLQRLQQQYGMFQEQKLGVSGEVAQYRDGLLKPILAKVQGAIKEIAQEEGLNFVLDKISSVVLYSEDKADITFKVIDKLKRGH